MIALILAGCESAPQKPPEPEKPACTLSSDTLDGRSFVREARNKDNTADEPDRWARMKFTKQGDKLKVRYNSRSPFDMYDYSCTKAKQGFECKVDKTDLEQWCRTLVANKGACSPAELADMTGAPIADATAAHKTVTEAMKKLTPDQLQQMKVQFNQPNNQLRGMLKVKVNAEQCKLAVVDTYQTMTEGTLREVENYVGNSRFVEMTEPLPFAHCNVSKLVALTEPGAIKTTQPGQTKLAWEAGQDVPFAIVDPDLATPDPKCTYAVDVWSDFVRVEENRAVTPDAEGKLVYTYTGKFTDPGSHVVQFTRYKACDGQPPVVHDETCALVKVGG